MKLSILVFILLTANAFCQTDDQVIAASMDYKAMNGMQIQLLNTDDAKLFVSFTGDKDNLNGVATLFLKQSKADLEEGTKNGIYAGIGFGESDMYNLDMVTLHYWPKLNADNAEFMIGDCWSPSDQRIVKLDKAYVTPANMDLVNIENAVFSYTPLSRSDGFQSKMMWSFTKKLDKLDDFDWAEFQNWQTNEGKVSGVWGWNRPTDHATAPNMPGSHGGSSSAPVRKLMDGEGIEGTGTSTSSFVRISIAALFCILLFLF